MKFKVGDKIVDKYSGRIGVVVSIRTTRVAPYHIRFGNNYLYRSARDMEMWERKDMESDKVMSKQKLYMNMALVNQLGVRVLGREVFVPLKDHADNLQGVLMVFDNYEDARKYNTDHGVVELVATEMQAESSKLDD